MENEFCGLRRNDNYVGYLENTKNNVQVSIELSSVCNFHCYYCQYPKMERKKDLISDKMFYHLADQLPEIAKGDGVGVNWAGESTLHPKFLEYTKYLNNMGFKIALPTNGSTLNSRMFEIEFAWIQVYLDKSAGDFSRRSKNNYEEHIQRILGFTKEWLKNDSTVRLRYWIQKTKTDVTDGPNLQAKYDFLKWFTLELGLTEELKLDFSNRVIAEFKKKNGGLLQFGQMPILSGGIFPDTKDNPAIDYHHLNRNFGFCDSAWKHTKVTNDGRLTLCCQALEGKTIFSQPDEIWKKSIKDIWLHNEEVEKYREHMIRGEVIYDVCRQCLDAFPKRELYHPHHLDYKKELQKYLLGEIIAFDADGSGNKYVVSGFAPPTNLTWSMAPRAYLQMLLNGISSNPRMKMEFDAVARVAVDGSDRDFFEVYVNGIRYAKLPIIQQKLHKYEVDLSGILIENCEVLNIEFIVSDRAASFLPMNPANMPRIGLQSLLFKLAE